MAAFFIAGEKFAALFRHQFMITSTSGMRSGSGSGVAAAVEDELPADVGRVDCFLRAMRGHFTRISRYSKPFWR